MNLRVGQGVDFHRLIEGRDFWLGGILIPHTKGALGHSDADVLLHAICDGLLGAACLGDIGTHFPDTSLEFKNIDSKILLQRTVSLLNKNHYSVINVDCMLCLQAPKIKPYIAQMQQTIAGIINVDNDCISIKATTTEGLGFVGREEGVMAYATVLIEKRK
ncbi:MAG: 2-C-methyl-D-erythritol 2,4-cyclodiphosphate synthase [Bacteroidota bacterium]|nr:2-C-methyl-D-erythritol 2,4-cyclodiphosphate synthase [Bacteroidota bacterium]